MPKKQTATLTPCELPNSHNFTNLTGKVFGRLTVTHLAGKTPKNRYYWSCTCSCGKTTIVSRSSLKSGNTQSCGCLHTETVTTHGESQTPEYRAWRGMIDRCHNPASFAFENYGGRGIFVCERWKSSYDNFLADMGRRTSPNHSLDRTDNDGPYSPDNCQWVTAKQQGRNQRTNCYITYNGETLTVTDWAARLGFHVITLHARIFRYGWSVDDAFSRPVRQSNR